jgi:hypothetical protein
MTASVDLPPASSVFKDEANNKSCNNATNILDSISDVSTRNIYHWLLAEQMDDLHKFLLCSIK